MLRSKEALVNNRVKIPQQSQNSKLLLKKTKIKKTAVEMNKMMRNNQMGKSKIMKRNNNIEFNMMN